MKTLILKDIFYINKQIRMLGLIILAIMGGVTLIFELKAAQGFSLEGWLLELANAFAMFHIVTAFNLPTVVKYGREKARTAIVAVYLVLIGAGYGIYKLLESSIIIDYEGLLSFVRGDAEHTALIITGVSLLIYLISCAVSMKIFENREF